MRIVIFQSHECLKDQNCDKKEVKRNPNEWNAGRRCKNLRHSCIEETFCEGAEGWWCRWRDWSLSFVGANWMGRSFWLFGHFCFDIFFVYSTENWIKCFFYFRNSKDDFCKQDNLIKRYFWKKSLYFSVFMIRFSKLIFVTRKQLEKLCRKRNFFHNWELSSSYSEC